MMRQTSLLSYENDSSSIDSCTISPFLEMGAYEELWSHKGATFKRLADRFKESPDSFPSSFVAKEKAHEVSRKVLDMIRASGVENFGISINKGGYYPAKLRNAKNPIEFFYYRGWWDLVESKSVAVVGSRKVSELGKKRAAKLVRLLVKDGFTIVSGLAEGVDTVAHTTAIAEGGKTIAVIGTPINECYPKQNKELQEYIAKNHLLISQVPLIRYSQQDYRSNRAFFPERNRTMSALTEATVIIEASDTSGTLIQARAARYQNRKLFILESCFQNKNITWPAKLEKKGAIRVKEYEDIKRVLG